MDLSRKLELGRSSFLRGVIGTSLVLVFVFVAEVLAAENDSNKITMKSCIGLIIVVCPVFVVVGSVAGT